MFYQFVHIINTQVRGIVRRPLRRYTYATFFKLDHYTGKIVATAATVATETTTTTTTTTAGGHPGGYDHPILSDWGYYKRAGQMQVTMPGCGNIMGLRVC